MYAYTGRHLMNTAEKVEIWNASDSLEEFAMATVMNKYAASSWAYHQRKKGQHMKYFQQQISPESFVEVWNASTHIEEVMEYFNISETGANQRRANGRKLKGYEYKKLISVKDAARDALAAKIGEAASARNLTARGIAKEFGISIESVRYIVKQYNIPIARNTKIDPDEFAELWNSGYMIKDLAAHFDKTESDIRGYKWRLSKTRDLKPATRKIPKKR